MARITTVLDSCSHWCEFDSQLSCHCVDPQVSFIQPTTSVIKQQNLVSHHTTQYRSFGSYGTRATESEISGTQYALWLTQLLSFLITNHRHLSRTSNKILSAMKMNEIILVPSTFFIIIILVHVSYNLYL